MSVQRAHTVKKARKDPGVCGSCKKELKAGDGYVWWTMGFRAKYRYIRCMASACFPRPSERETSKAQTILAAQESFADNIDNLTTVDEVVEAVGQVAEAVGGVRDEYQEALEAWENGNEQLQEKVDHYEEQASELESWSFDGEEEWKPCDEHTDEDLDGSVVEECEDCMTNRETWLDELREAAREAVDNVETL